MLVKKITDSRAWEEFVKQQAYTLFVQSAHYGSFYETLGEESWLFGVYEDDISQTILGGALIVSTHAKRGNFLYIPYGPLFAPQLTENKQIEIEAVFFSYLEKFAKEKKYHFIRVSPFADNTPALKTRYASLGFHDAPMHALAEYTWLLDLQKTEEQLLSDMEKNHRNLIRRCQKEGVRVEISTDMAAVHDFNQLHDVTAARHKFHRFPSDYVNKEFTAFSKTNAAVIIRAYLPDGTLDAAGIFMYYGTMGAYRHGASLMTDKKIPTSYLLQWEAIKEAKRRGMLWYNFWGIAPDTATKDHPFYGITHFKKGFGGFAKELLHCQDRALTAWYWSTWLIEKIRSIKRGFLN